MGKLVELNVQDLQSAGLGHTDWQNIIKALSSVGFSQKHPALDTTSPSTLLLHVNLGRNYTRYVHKQMLFRTDRLS